MPGCQVSGGRKACPRICSRSQDPLPLHRLRCDPGSPVPTESLGPGPAPVGAAPRRLQDQDERLRPLLLSHQCPVVPGPRAPSVPGTAPGTPKPAEWARDCPQPALAAFPVPRRRPRAPQAGRERASYLCSGPCGAGSGGGGRGRWVLGAVLEQRGLRGPPRSSRRLSRLSRPESSASSFWATSLTSLGRPCTSSRPRPSAQAPPALKVPRALPAPNAPPCAQCTPAPNAPGCPLRPRRPESSGRAAAA